MSGSITLQVERLVKVANDSADLYTDSIDLVRYIGRQLNWSVEFVTSRDNRWGVLHDNNTWDGVMGDIKDGYINMSLPFMTTNWHRSRDFAVSTPAKRTEFCFAINPATIQTTIMLNWWAVFTPKLWAQFLLTGAALGLLAIKFRKQRPDIIIIFLIYIQIIYFLFNTFVLNQRMQRVHLPALSIALDNSEPSKTGSNLNHINYTRYLKTRVNNENSHDLSNGTISINNKLPSLTKLVFEPFPLRSPYQRKKRRPKDKHIIKHQTAKLRVVRYKRYKSDGELQMLKYIVKQVQETIDMMAGLEQDGLVTYDCETIGDCLEYISEYADAFVYYDCWTLQLEAHKRRLGRSKLLIYQHNKAILMFASIMSRKSEPKFMSTVDAALIGALEVGIGRRMARYLEFTMPRLISTDAGSLPPPLTNQTGLMDPIDMAEFRSILWSYAVWNTITWFALLIEIGIMSYATIIETTLFNV